MIRTHVAYVPTVVDVMAKLAPVTFLDGALRLKPIALSDRVAARQWAPATGGVCPQIAPVAGTNLNVAVQGKTRVLGGRAWSPPN